MKPYRKPRYVFMAEGTPYSCKDGELRPEGEGREKVPARRNARFLVSDGRKALVVAIDGSILVNLISGKLLDQAVSDAFRGRKAPGVRTSPCKALRLRYVDVHYLFPDWLMPDGYSREFSFVDPGKMLASEAGLKFLRVLEWGLRGRNKTTFLSEKDYYALPKGFSADKSKTTRKAVIHVVVDARSEVL